MFPTTENQTYLIIMTLAFVAVILLLEGLFMIWKSYKGPEARKIEKRLLALSASFDTTKQAQLLKQNMLSAIPPLERLLLSMPRLHSLDRNLYQAGLEWTVSRLFLSCAVFGITGFAMAIAFAQASTLWATAVGVGFAVLPFAFVQEKRRRRLLKIESQLPDALDLLIRAIRAGHAFNAGLQMIGEEMAEPIAGEFRIVHDEVNFGVSLQQALTNLTERVPLTDLRYFVVALLIQRESGGNLGEVLGNLSRLIRERLKLNGKIKVLSSEGRMSAWILVMLPFALGGMMNFFNPEFMSPLWKDPAGILIVKALLTLMAIGVLILRKIVRIRV
jgi:tight adherence protein B